MKLPPYGYLAANDDYRNSYAERRRHARPHSEPEVIEGCEPWPAGITLPIITAGAAMTWTAIALAALAWAWPS